MVKPLAGEVVVVPFPQTDLQPGKRRPALVVAELAGDDLILCQITSQIRTDAFAVPLTATDFANVDASRRRAISGSIDSLRSIDRSSSIRRRRWREPSLTR